MAYTTTGITIVSDVAHDLGRVVRVICAHPDKVVQMYGCGELKDARAPTGGVSDFFLHDTPETDVLFFLAVDPEEAWENYWDRAFPAAAVHGNRIRLRLPQWKTYGLHDVAEVYRGDAGDGEANILVHRQDMFPNGRGAAGYGLGAYGDGGYGHDGANCPGYGYGYGYQYGFGCDLIVVVTESFPPGRYPVRIVVKDRYGNESTAAGDVVTLRTYARPATGLEIDSYVKATDTLTLSFTPSPDM